MSCGVAGSLLTSGWGPGVPVRTDPRSLMRLNQGARPHRETLSRWGRTHLEPLVPGATEEARRVPRLLLA